MTDLIRFLKLREVTAMTSLSRTTIYRRMGETTFPKPVVITPACVRWRQQDVQAWMAQFRPKPDAVHDLN